MITGLDHIGIIVRNLEEAAAFYTEKLGLELNRIEELPREGVRIAFIPIGDTEIELIEPTNADNSIGKYLEKHGEGLHHLCFRTKDEVADLQRHLDELAAAGTPMIDRTARPGASDAWVGFLQPKAANGVLVELSTPHKKKHS